jgi:hypothetical protein
MGGLRQNATRRPSRRCTTWRPAPTPASDAEKQSGALRHLSSVYGHHRPVPAALGFYSPHSIGGEESVAYSSIDPS